MDNKIEETFIFNLILMLFDNSDYKYIDGEDFRAYVCEGTGMSQEYFNTHIKTTKGVS